MAYHLAQQPIHMPHSDWPVWNDVKDHDALAACPAETLHVGFNDLGMRFNAFPQQGVKSLANKSFRQ